jgi:hypothetical protein
VLRYILPTVVRCGKYIEDCSMAVVLVILAVIGPPGVVHVYRVDGSREGEPIQQCGEFFPIDLLEWWRHALLLSSNGRYRIWKT